MTCLIDLIPISILDTEHASFPFHAEPTQLHSAPAGERDFHYLITSGVSDRPMSSEESEPELSRRTGDRLAFVLGRQREGLPTTGHLRADQAGEGFSAVSAHLSNVLR